MRALKNGGPVMIQYHHHHPCTGILEEYPRDRLLTRHHFFTLPSKLMITRSSLCSSLLHTIMIIIQIMLVAQRTYHMSTCCLLALAYAANFAAYLLLTLRGVFFFVKMANFILFFPNWRKF